MADGDNAATGMLGILVGVMLVILLATAFFMHSGRIGPSEPTFTIRMPGAR